MDADRLAKLHALRRARTAGDGSRAGRLEALLDPGGEAACRLAVYGSLAPGEAHHGELAALNGRWYPGTVRGRLLDRGWGARIGFPALRWDPAGPAVAVRVFESPDLLHHWARLDLFEGSGYDRILVPVDCAGNELLANLYALADQPR